MPYPTINMWVFNPSHPIIQYFEISIAPYLPICYWGGGSNFEPLYLFLYIQLIF